MSASLVGSEMCIRDRTTARALLSEAGHAWPCPMRLNISANQNAALEGICLLYTSDAADDM
eukprot:9105054-Alexandrium_andersonii.AAC.1